MVASLLSRPLVRVALIVIVAYLALCLLVWLLQRRIMYVPDASNPSLPDLPGLRDVSLRTADELTLRAWVWEPSSAQGTVLLFHGNASNRANRLFWMRQVNEMGFCAFVPDYRGYGGSDGSPTEHGLYLDGKASIAYATASLPKPLFLAGTSVGSGVAVEMALHHPCAGLVLTAPMTSAAKAGQDAFPFLPVGLLLKDRFDNLSKIGRVHAPILFLHGEADAIMPIQHSLALHGAANDPKEYVSLPGVGHNNVWDAADDAYWTALQRFLLQYR